jgi:cytoskeletal protein CcmA (bactofilin family)
MKMKFRLLTFMMVLALAPTGAAFAQGPGPDGGRVVFGENLTIESGDTFSGDLVVFGGNVTVEEGAGLDGNLVVFGGTVSSDGEVDGDLVIIGGQVSLDEHAVVTGDVVTVGGQLNREEGSVIEGEVVNNVRPEITIPDAPVVPDVNVPEVVNVRFNPFWEFGRVTGVSLFMAFLAMLVTLFFQDRLSRVSQAAISQPLMTSSIGLLTFVALILVGVTIILLPVALIGLIPLALAWLFGVVALGQEIGDRFARAVQQDWKPVLTASLGTFVLVFLLATLDSLNNLVPFMVCVTWIFPALIGLLAVGSVVITRFGTRPIQSAGLSAYAPPSDPGQAPPTA